MTWSSYGSAQGQPELQHVGLPLRASATAPDSSPGNNVTVTCHGAVQGAFSSTVVQADGNGVVVDDPACYFGYNESFWISMNGVESQHRQWPG